MKSQCKVFKLLFMLITLVFMSITYAQSDTSSFAKGATQPIKFNRLITENGLSHNDVTGIVRGDKGFMWFSTFDGLNRYDGYNFKVYRHDPKNSNSLAYVVKQNIMLRVVLKNLEILPNTLNLKEILICTDESEISLKIKQLRSLAT